MFGLCAHHIQNVSKTYREREIKTRKVRDQFRIIEPDNYQRLEIIIDILTKPPGKRSRESLIKYIVPLLEKNEFFEIRKKLTPHDIESVAQNIRYVCFEPGETKIGRAHV